MGHRALIAYEREDGLYNVHYSHWGAANLRLRDEITEDTPFGGDNTEPEFVTALVRSLDEGTGDMEVGGHATEAQEPTEIQPEPEVVGASMEEIVTEHLDYLFCEAFYVVDRNFEVAAYRTLWLGPKAGGDTVGNGILYLPNFTDGEEDDRGLSSKFNSWKQVAKDAERDGVISEDEAREYLIRRVENYVAYTDLEIPEFSPYGYPPETHAPNRTAEVGFMSDRSYDNPNYP